MVAALLLRGRRHRRQVIRQVGAVALQGVARRHRPAVREVAERHRRVIRQAAAVALQAVHHRPVQEQPKPVLPVAGVVRAASAVVVFPSRW